MYLKGEGGDSSSICVGEESQFQYESSSSSPTRLINKMWELLIAAYLSSNMSETAVQHLEPAGRHTWAHEESQKRLKHKPKD